LEVDAIIEGCEVEVEADVAALGWATSVTSSLETNEEALANGQ
jgi:hypothetical protein